MSRPENVSTKSDEDHRRQRRFATLAPSAHAGR